MKIFNVIDFDNISSISTVIYQFDNKESYRMVCLII